MQAKRRKVRFDLSWNRIPRFRRHVYVYALLLLGAIVGNNISHAFSDLSDDVPAQKGQSSIANLKAKTNLLYR